MSSRSVACRHLLNPIRSIKTKAVRPHSTPKFSRPTLTPDPRTSENGGRSGERDEPRRRTGWRRIIPFLWALPPLLVMNQFVVGIVQITGRSMKPTLNPDTRKDRDVVLLDKLVLATGSLQRGDVVVLVAPHDPDLRLVKRVTALGGDVVRPRQIVKRPFMTITPDAFPWTRESGVPQTLRIPKGYCWVESDDPASGADSNVFGPIPLGLIEGRATHIVWPVDRMGNLERRQIGRSNRIA
ncbi:hypothetical protein HDU67_000587 [Dinochytrium kinnereticum]|nr:hypothetical protein HDU67_000587 [Dinochytrium kinnereticum]